MLDERGIHTICAVLDVEYARCTNAGGDTIINALMVLDMKINN